MAFANFFGNKFVTISGAPKKVEFEEEEVTMEEGKVEARRLPAKRPKRESSRPKREPLREMEEMTYSTILSPFNSTVMSIEEDRPPLVPGAVPAPPPLPPQSAPRTGCSVRVAANIESAPAPDESSTVSIPTVSSQEDYCSALMEVRDRILHRSQEGEGRIKRGILFPV